MAREAQRGVAGCKLGLVSLVELLSGWEMGSERRKAFRRGSTTGKISITLKSIVLVPSSPSTADKGWGRRWLEEQAAKQTWARLGRLCVHVRGMWNVCLEQLTFGERQTGVFILKCRSKRQNLVHGR